MNTCDKILIVPDIHQDLNFLNTAIENEKPDQIILLGDIFDTHHREGSNGIATGRETAQRIKELKEKFGANLVILMGNHDMAYYEINVNNSFDFLCSGVSFSKAATIHEVWGNEFWNNFEAVKLINGYLFSHAGVASKFWHPILEPQKAYEDLYRVTMEALRSFDNNAQLLFGAGKARNGRNNVGGIIWQDWDKEFKDKLPYPQIVGHTYGRFPRMKGKSICIDCGQKTYAVMRGADISIVTI